MSRYFMLCSGQIIGEHPDPFVLESLEEGLDIIENHFKSILSFYSDMISIYEMPVNTGRAKLVWRFTGLEYIYDLVESEKISNQVSLINTDGQPFVQGKLNNHTMSLYDELSDQNVDEFRLDEDYNDEYDDIVNVILDEITPF